MRNIVQDEFVRYQVECLNKNVFNFGRVYDGQFKFQDALHIKGLLKYNFLPNLYCKCY